jgi:TPR repeat protein
LPSCIFAFLLIVCYVGAMSASFSQYQRSPEDLQQLQQLLAWYKIRDLLLGENYVKQDVKNALELASACEHFNAVWLAMVFAEHDVSTPSKASQVFRDCENDPLRARCFAALLDYSDDDIHPAADLGDAYAQVRMACLTYGRERFVWAEKSAAQGERDSFFVLGCWFECEGDVEKAKENFLIAAALGHVDAMTWFGSLFDETDPQQFVWLGKAAVSGSVVPFLNNMSDPINDFSSGTEHTNVIFAIGRALKGHIDNEKRTIFGSDYNVDSLLDPANQALQFYNFQLRSYRKAVDTWTLVGIWCQVVKDIRKLIAKMIWESRDEAKY